MRAANERRPGRIGPDCNAQGERGAAKIAGAIAGARVSSVNYAKVVSHFVHAGMPERNVDSMLDPLPMTVVPADKALAQVAGRLRGVTAEAGLSLADRFCLPLACLRWKPVTAANSSSKRPLLRLSADR
jgi:ribonuclease VapC